VPYVSKWMTLAQALKQSSEARTSSLRSTRAYAMFQDSVTGCWHQGFRSLAVHYDPPGISCKKYGWLTSGIWITAEL